MLINNQIDENKSINKKKIYNTTIFDNLKLQVAIINFHYCNHFDISNRFYHKNKNFSSNRLFVILDITFFHL